MTRQRKPDPAEADELCRKKYFSIGDLASTFLKKLPAQSKVKV